MSQILLESLKNKFYINSVYVTVHRETSLGVKQIILQKMEKTIKI